MKEDDSVVVQYTDINLCYKYGAKPFKVSQSLANEYQKRGWAKIIQAPPAANPSLSDEDIEKINKKYEDESVNFMLEEGFKNKISIVSGTIFDRHLQRVGEKLGFEVSTNYPGNLSPNPLLLSDLIILGSNLRGFNSTQINMIDGILFQKCLPFIYRIDSKIVNDITRFRHCSFHAKLVSFTTHKVFDFGIEMLGEMIEDKWFIEEDISPHEFWKKVEEVLRDMK